MMGPLPGVYLTCVLLFTTAAAAISQETAIRANVSVVLVPVTVTDKKGKFVDGLREGEFALSDTGRPQRIALDTSETLAPISLVIAVQTSDIAAPMLAKFTKVGSLIQPLVTGEKGEVDPGPPAHWEFCPAARPGEQGATM